MASRTLNRLALWWLGGAPWVERLMSWSRKIETTGQTHGLNPALRETFAEVVASGHDIEDAACRALEGTEIVDVIASTQGDQE